jgi:hypothetical protein
MTANVLAQAPQSMSYQAVIRNSSNALVASTQVGMKISILQATSTGTAVYVETQTPTTDANGLVSLAIGGGTATTGTFAGVDWSVGPYFIKTETDPAGGTSYSITGTSQLLSVPYALNAGSITNAKGIALAKLTTTERAALVSPSVGTLIYNTTLNKFQGYTFVSGNTSVNYNNTTGSGSNLIIPTNSGFGQSFTATNTWSINTFGTTLNTNNPNGSTPPTSSNPNATAGPVTIYFYSGTPGSGTLLGSATSSIMINAGNINFTFITAIVVPAGLAYWEIRTNSASSFSIFAPGANYSDTATESLYTFDVSDAATSVPSKSSVFSMNYSYVNANPSWASFVTQ